MANVADTLTAAQHVTALVRTLAVNPPLKAPTRPASGQLWPRGDGTVRTG